MSDQHASETVRNAAQRAKNTLAETVERVEGAAAEAGEKAQGVAREAGRQAAAAAQTLYGQGDAVRDVVERAVVGNPWSAILIAGALGYGLACLVKQR